jgi:murein DD-endopeptidase MepM/ murein hydrolase activator NlpD
VRRAALLPALALLAMGAGKPDQSTHQVPLDQETEHVVKDGETLAGVANRARVPRVLIAEANGLKPPYVLRTGQKLKIPRTRHHTVVRGETGFTVAYTYGVPWQDIAVANGIEPDAPLKPGQKLLIPTLIDQPKAESAAPSPSPAPSAAATPAAARFAWPVAGPVRRGFVARATDSENHHDGIDISAAEGTAVRAGAAGKVLFAGAEPTQFGNLVVIDHGDGWATAYAFLSKITVEKDEAVRAGERIGLVGHTGRARGSELHFEVRRNNRPIDPATELPEAPAAAASPASRTPRPSPDKPPAKSHSRSGDNAKPGHGAPGRAKPQE